LLNSEHQFLYNPYLIAMGSVKWDFANPEMVMIGTETGDPSEMEDLINLYKPLMRNNPRYVTGTWDECEAIKIFYNTFISAKVGLVNMIQDFALKIGNINVDVVTDALAQSTMRIMGPKYMTAGMGDAGACHPRDNIALRWLAQEYDIGYDMFDTIMGAREVQAKNLADFLLEHADDRPIVIHGKAYKPDVPYCIGSYSTLIGYYIEQAGKTVKYIDPIADDRTNCVDSIEEASIVLYAHNRYITYGYTGQSAVMNDFYCDIPDGSIIVDPFRSLPKKSNRYEVIHYGNTRKKS
jgi:UDPglucose 6-dehydrogenase